ncbi:MAG: NAD(P)-dependent oxidoreductase [Burkholderia sp.]|nr:NAD(P)-dependent oxidoreductase [Burkholderia sp.]
MAIKQTGDIAARRLSPEQLSCEFSDIAPLLDASAAAAAASRCHYCYDAPCVNACPTQIDIPSFIRKIGNGNLKGAAVDILSANPLGGMCARVCPTEILCEGACVRNHQDAKPVAIGALQRHATDWAMARGEALFTRAPESIAAYKTVDDFAQREVEWLCSVGGIEIRHGVALGRDVQLDALRNQYDAVFLAIGLTGVRALAMAGEDLSGVMNAVDFIEALRSARDFGTVPVGRRVVVIGGGNTAVDAAVQSRKLGAASVTMVYRRGVESMSATWAERDFAQTNGVTLITHATPLRLIGENGVVTGVEFERSFNTGDAERFVIEADMVLKAIGQTLVPAGIARELLTLDGGRIAVDANGQTSLAGVWAGGDCAATGGIDLTVQAVQDGKLAAEAIHAQFARADIKAA